MWAMRAFFAAALVAAFVTLAEPASAQRCISHDFRYDAGKTAEGFEATMKAGCHTVHWTANTVDIAASGSVSFETFGNAAPWSAAFPSSPAGGDSNRCEHYAVQDANRYATNLLGLPRGTEVTVSYRCY